MRSQVIRPAPVEELVNRHTWNARPDMQAVKDNLYQIALKHKRYEQVDTVCAGDIISVCLKSSHKKFNRTAKLQVGGNLFDAQLESALIGKCVGQCGTMEHPLGQIDYEIRDAQRLVVPALTDEMACNVGVEGVQSVAQLREHYLDESLKKAIYDEVYYFVPQHMEQWQFAIEEADLHDMDEHEMERCRAISRSMGEVFDEMTEQQLLGAVGCPSIPAFREMIHDYHRQTIKVVLAEAWLTGRNMETVTPGDVNDLCYAFTERVTKYAMKIIKEELAC